MLVGEDGTLGGPVAKNLTDAEREGLAAHVGAQPGDCVFFAAGATKPMRALLGAARGEIARKKDLIDPDAWAFVWIVDAPMFEPTADATASGDVALGHSAWTAVHNAFTSPKPEFFDTFDTDPDSALAYAYDIVCNGNEIGGGSIRIHRKDIQERVFKVMGISEDEAQGAVRLPPRRLRLRCAAARAESHSAGTASPRSLAGMDSIREVIAFPKSGGGVDPADGCSGTRSRLSSARNRVSTRSPRRSQRTKKSEGDTGEAK